MKEDEIMMENIMKINDQEVEAVAGGTVRPHGEWKTVRSLPGGYLAIRTAPAYLYENEINHIGLINGEQVQIAGPSVQGTGINGSRVSYAYVYSPKYNCCGYVNAHYLG